MDILFVIHGRLSSAVMLFSAACGAWGLWAVWRKQPVSSNYWGTLAIGELLIVAQGMVGLALAIGGSSPDRPAHFMYGVLVAMVWPAVFVYTHGRDGRRDILIYGLASLLLLALAFRAMVTG